jgi:hypothetical protein
MIDTILTILLGAAVLGLAVWGALVSVETLSPKKRPIHFWGLIALGICAFGLTVAIGLRGYFTQKESDRKMKELGETLHDTQQAQVGTNMSLQTANLQLADMNGQMKMFGLIMNKSSNDNNTNMQMLGAALRGSQAAVPEGNRYRQMSTPELRQEATSMATTLRNLASTYDSLGNQIIADWRKTPPDANSMNVLSQKQVTLFSRLKEQYGQCCRMYAISLREEMLRREGIVTGFQEENLNAFFFNEPTNPLGLRKVSDELERLAVGLRETKTKP